MNLWLWFCLIKLHRCPKCLTRLYSYHDKMVYDYCPKCIDYAYFEDLTKVEFRD